MKATNGKRISSALVAIALVVAACGTPDEDNNGTPNGMTNGTTNGMTNGTTNGMTNGTTNGMTNGTTNNGVEPLDPETAPRAEIDRFSAEAGTLMVRTDDNGLPGPGEPIDYDQAPFITTGLGPDGEVVQYYNFDVQATESAPIFALFREGEDAPVEGQLNIVNTIPGDEGYNDFWHVHKVTVPADYVANTITSVQAVMDSGYPIEQTDILVNCPIVPDGSTATKRLDDADTGLTLGWYEDQVVYYFNFAEKQLRVDPPEEGHPMVPMSPIFVTFNVNPDDNDPNSGPASGFVAEDGTEQTHNVVATLPDDDGYSPLWSVNVYDNADFDGVSDLNSASNANILATDVADVNCPIVSVQ
jgi:hypothetical protein